MFDESIQKKTIQEEEDQEKINKPTTLKALKRNSTFIPAQFETGQQDVHIKNIGTVSKELFDRCANFWFEDPIAKIYYLHH